MRIVAVADTHLFTDDVVVPPGDLFIHAGDLLRGGSFDELQAGVEWLRTMEHPHKIFVAGNHDRCFEKDVDRARSMLPDGFVYLQDDGVEIDGLRIWGSPWQPEFLNWAFNLPRGEALAEKWDQIPEDTDILITHGPPHGFGDRAWGEHLGCRELTRAIHRVRPMLHCFGHIHEDRGVWDEEGVTIANVTSNEGDHSPMVFDFDGTRIVRVALIVLMSSLTLGWSSRVFAQTEDRVDAGTHEADGGAPRIVIEGLWDEDPANLRAPAWERTELPEPIVRDAAWVAEVLERTETMVRGLQRPAQRELELVPYFRAAVRYHAAAHIALEQGDLESAAFLSMHARNIVRRGLEQENVTLFDPVDDTTDEIDYAAQGDPKEATHYLKQAYLLWGRRETNPFRSPHHFRLSDPAPIE